MSTTLIYGEKNTVLVDPPLRIEQAQFGRRVVEEDFVEVRLAGEVADRTDVDRIDPRGPGAC
ncbi:hypothetical protein [Streptomyces sp. NPDC002402]